MCLRASSNMQKWLPVHWACLCCWWRFFRYFRILKMRTGHRDTFILILNVFLSSSCTYSYSYINNMNCIQASFDCRCGRATRIKLCTKICVCLLLMEMVAEDFDSCRFFRSHCFLFLALQLPPSAAVYQWERTKARAQDNVIITWMVEAHFWGIYPAAVG